MVCALSVGWRKQLLLTSLFEGARGTCVCCKGRPGRVGRRQGGPSRRRDLGGIQGQADICRGAKPGCKGWQQGGWGGRDGPLPGLGNALSSQNWSCPPWARPSPMVGRDGCTHLKARSAGVGNWGAAELCVLWGPGTGLGRARGRVRGRRGGGKAALKGELFLWLSVERRWGSPLPASATVETSPPKVL